MHQNRSLLMLLSLLGLACSSWMARPSELASADGWLFSIAWSSLAWCVLCWGAIRWRSLASIAAGLITVAVLDVASFSVASDPLMLAAKPLWQLPALGLAAGIEYALRIKEGTDG